ncbi:MAG: hypothetical protein NTV62_00820 [Candidatus Gribaldobacteria bacterium]|nr:hypothetical protein [Candidatus Gribaldobacteria bacterium]
MKTLFRFLIILASFILALLAKSFLGQISLLGLNLNLVFILVFILSLR